MLKLFCISVLSVVLWSQYCSAGSWFSFTQEGQEGYPRPIFGPTADKSTDDILSECQKMHLAKKKRAKPVHILLGRAAPPVISEICEQLLRKRQLFDE